MVRTLFVEYLNVPEDLYDKEEEAFYTLIYNTVSEFKGKKLKPQTYDYLDAFGQYPNESNLCSLFNNSAYVFLYKVHFEHTPEYREFCSQVRSQSSK